MFFMATRGVGRLFVDHEINQSMYNFAIIIRATYKWFLQGICTLVEMFIKTMADIIYSFQSIQQSYQHIKKKPILYSSENYLL